MNDVLVRIPLAGDVEFQPLALAPGLPMLDARKLTYQVLLGWFGDLLAEPELDEHGVVFHVQRGGKRVPVLDRWLVTDRDLNGPLAEEFDRLKKALFDVRPVSPSERLIFNRLQPPIGQYAGFLYRVRTEDSENRLAWCWGFQRRQNDGTARLCPLPECSALFFEQGAPLIGCPRCGHSLAIAEIHPLPRRTKFPAGAAAAASLLVAVLAGTYWHATGAAGHTDDFIGELASDDLPGMAKVGVIDPGRRPSDGSQPAGTPEPNGTSDPLAPTTTPPASVTASSTPSVTEALPVTPDSPASDAPTSSSPAVPSTGTPSVDAGVPRIIDLPDPAAISPAPPTATASTLDPAVKPDATKTPAAPGKSDTPGTIKEPPTQQLAALTWHESYLQGYQDGLQQRRMLLMLFRDRAESDQLEAEAGGLSDPQLRPLLEGVARAALSVNAVMPGQAGPTPTLMLEHRSFRHLGRRPGLVVVDLTEQGGAQFGRVVSALPLPADGRFQPDVIANLLTLPRGSIGLRTLTLTGRATQPRSGFTSENSATLNDLATHGARLMAQTSQAVAVEQAERFRAARATFGAQAKLDELVFVTDSAASIQDAALSALRGWISNPADMAALSQSAGFFGADMVQGSDDRWYVSLILARP